MSDDDGGTPDPEPIDLADLFPDLDEPVPYVPTPIGEVDATVRLGDSVARVTTSGDCILLTLTGPDGMVTARFPDTVAVLLTDLLNAAVIDVRKSRRGRS